MTWYRENRWLGNFLIAFAAALLIGLWFLFHAKGAFADAMTEFNAVATERSRLEHLNPFPNEDNFRKTQAALENYGAELEKTKEELKKRVVAQTPLAPNEFQSRLRQAILNATERARANRVKLPEIFFLGFDEFATTLPNTAAAPGLGQELAQVELLINILIDARVDAITGLKRDVPAETAPAAIAPKAATSSSIVEGAVVDLSFAASPSAMRKVLNQIASSEQAFFIVRSLRVQNEQQKGPSREASASAKNTTGSVPPATAGSAGAIKFIVGNEHVETAAKIELVKFAF
jgi:hypothetical protein